MEDKYAKLKLRLEESLEWPHVYMFKFIVKSNQENIAQVEALFNTTEAQVTLRESGKGNFVSITGKELMLSPEAVIERYRKAEKIEGVISL